VLRCSSGRGGASASSNRPRAPFLMSRGWQLRLGRYHLSVLTGTNNSDDLQRMAVIMAEPRGSAVMLDT
jgi:hypothetical protein